jgi:hypothetical protein
MVILIKGNTSFDTITCQNVQVDLLFSERKKLGFKDKWHDQCFLILLFLFSSM